MQAATNFAAVKLPSCINLPPIFSFGSLSKFRLQPFVRRPFFVPTECRQGTQKRYSSFYPRVIFATIISRRKEVILARWSLVRMTVDGRFDRRQEVSRKKLSMFKYKKEEYMKEERRERRSETVKRRFEKRQEQELCVYQSGRYALPSLYEDEEKIRSSRGINDIRHWKRRIGEGTIESSERVRVRSRIIANFVHHRDTQLKEIEPIDIYALVVCVWRYLMTSMTILKRFRDAWRDWQRDSDLTGLFRGMTGFLLRYDRNSPRYDWDSPRYDWDSAKNALFQYS